MTKRKVSRLQRALMIKLGLDNASNLKVDRFGNLITEDKQKRKQERFQEIMETAEAKMRINHEKLYKPEVNYVYVLKSLCLHKIGLSIDWEKRKTQISSKLPSKVFPIMVFGFPNRAEAVEMEKHLHQHFHKLRFQGEWFLLTDENLKELSNVCVNNGGSIVFDADWE